MGEYLYFVSHSKHDSELAKLFCNFLHNAMGIPEERIFCSSLYENIPSGTEDYLKFIRDAIFETKNSGGVMLALITSNFTSSNFCKYEMGALWINDMQSIPIVFPPLSCEDSSFQGSPISKTQAIVISSDNIDDSICDALSALVDRGQANEIVKKYISNVSNGKLMSSERDIAKKIESYIKNGILQKVYFDIIMNSCDAYQSQGYSHTMTFEKDNDDKCLIISADFSSDIPPFVGYYVRPLIPADWKPYIKEKFSLRFDAMSSEEMKGIIVEFKCFDYQITQKFCKFYAHSWMTYNVYLGDMNLNDKWDTMKEICFVLKENCLGNRKGSVILKNLRLERDPIY